MIDEYNLDMYSMLSWLYKSKDFSSFFNLLRIHSNYEGGYRHVSQFLKLNDHEFIQCYTEELHKSLLMINENDYSQYELEHAALLLSCASSHDCSVYSIRSLEWDEQTNYRVLKHNSLVDIPDNTLKLMLNFVINPKNSNKTAASDFVNFLIFVPATSELSDEISKKCISWLCDQFIDWNQRNSVYSFAGILRNLYLNENKEKTFTISLEGERVIHKINNEYIKNDKIKKLILINDAKQSVIELFEI